MKLKSRFGIIKQHFNQIVKLNNTFLKIQELNCVT